MTDNGSVSVPDPLVADLARRWHVTASMYASLRVNAAESHRGVDDMRAAYIRTAIEQTLRQAGTSQFVKKRDGKWFTNGRRNKTKVVPSEAFASVDEFDWWFRARVLREATDLLRGETRCEEREARRWESGSDSAALDHLADESGDEFEEARAVDDQVADLRARAEASSDADLSAVIDAFVALGQDTNGIPSWPEVARYLMWDSSRVLLARDGIRRLLPPE